MKKRHQPRSPQKLTVGTGALRRALHEEFAQPKPKRNNIGIAALQADIRAAKTPLKTKKLRNAGHAEAWRAKNPTAAGSINPTPNQRKQEHKKRMLVKRNKKKQGYDN